MKSASWITDMAIKTVCKSSHLAFNSSIKLLRAADSVTGKE